MARSLSATDIAHELFDYEVVLPPEALEQAACYLELLLHWNRRINMTSIREPRQIVRRLFGESLYLSNVVELRGWLVDVGSGPGFPGLALKLVAPDLRVTLIEARHRKCAFLKEVVRSCRFTGVDVVAERFESWVSGLSLLQRADITTTRAVVVTEGMMDRLGALLATGGKAVFMTTARLGDKIRKAGPDWYWEGDRLIPGGVDSILLVGRNG